MIITSPRLNTLFLLISMAVFGCGTEEDSSLSNAEDIWTNTLADIVKTMITSINPDVDIPPKLIGEAYPSNIKDPLFLKGEQERYQGRKTIVTNFVKEIEVGQFEYELIANFKNKIEDREGMFISSTYFKPIKYEFLQIPLVFPQQYEVSSTSTKPINAGTADNPNLEISIFLDFKYKNLLSVSSETLECTVNASKGLKCNSGLYDKTVIAHPIEGRWVSEFVEGDVTVKSELIINQPNSIESNIIAIDPKHGCTVTYHSILEATDAFSGISSGIFGYKEISPQEANEICDDGSSFHWVNEINSDEITLTYEFVDQNTLVIGETILKRKSSATCLMESSTQSC